MKIQIIIIISLVACTNIAEKKSEYKRVEFNKTLELTSVMSYKIDSITNVKPFNIEVYEHNNTEYLVAENSFKPSIRFYNLANKEFSHEIPLNVTGPNGVGEFKGFHVESMDSVFILNFNESKLFLVDSTGLVLNQWSWLTKNEDLKFKQSTPLIYTGSPAFYEKGVLSTMAVPAMGPTSKETYEQGSVNFQYDLINMEYGFNYNYPEIYQKEDYPHFWEYIFRCKAPDNTYIFSFSADPFIYATKDYSTSKEFYAGTSLFNKPISEKRLSRNTFLKSTAYMGIYFDKYNKVFYRVAIGDIGDEKNISKYDKPISIIILNENLNIVGEVELPKNKHDYRSLFVSKEGLCISNYNENNSELDEDIMSFSIYKLKDAFSD